jgi:hypothetical protein
MDDNAKNKDEVISFQDDEKEKSQVKKRRRPRKRSKKSDPLVKKNEVFSDKKPVEKPADPFSAPVGAFDQPLAADPSGAPDLSAAPPPTVSQPDTPVLPVTPAPMASQPDTSFPALDPVTQNVADKEDEFRYSETGYRNDEGGQKSEKAEEVEKVEEKPSPFMTEELVQPFSAPVNPQAPGTLDEKVLDEKPIDQVGRTSSMPEESIEDKDKEKERMIEDKEKDESIKATKATPFEEGAVKEYEQNDPLTTGPSEVQGGGVSDVVVADVTDGADGVGDSSEDDKPSFWDMLEEAGIEKRHIIMLVSVIGVIIAVVLFFVFGGYKLFTGSDDDFVQKPSVEQDDEPSVKKTSTGDSSVDPDFDQHFALSGLVNSYIFGLEFSSYRVLPGLNLNPVSYGGSTSAVDASLIAGQNLGVSKESISYYIDLVRRIDNAIHVDVYNYLNQYVDRRAVLQKHLASLNSLLLEAESSKNVVIQELNSLDAEYEATSLKKDEYETRFFDSMGGYNGDVAYDYLELFVEASQIRVKQKAYFNALNSVNGSLDAAISSLIPRIQDISVNAEALIKGVRVFEVTGSNIDAIILQQ